MDKTLIKLGCLGAPAIPEERAPFAWQPMRLVRFCWISQDVYQLLQKQTSQSDGQSRCRRLFHQDLRRLNAGWGRARMT